MVAFTGFRTPLKPRIDATSSVFSTPSRLAFAWRGYSAGLIICAALAIPLATGPAMPQAGVALVVTVCANNGVPIAVAISGSKNFMPKVL